MIFFTLFITFFKIGLFTFGGGYAMLPLIQAEVVSQGWINENQIIDFIAVSESTPGPFAINIATYIGTETGGFFGAVCTTLGVVLPSFIVILMQFLDNKFFMPLISLFTVTQTRGIPENQIVQFITLDIHCFRINAGTDLCSFGIEHCIDCGAFAASGASCNHQIDAFFFQLR